MDKTEVCTPRTIKYGDSLLVKMTPALEMEIASSLESWVLELSEKKDIDLLQEQFSQTKNIIRILLENSQIPKEV